jgi:hypothetical protein
MDPGEVGWGDVDWVGLAKDRNRWRALVNSVLNLSSSAQLHRVGNHTATVYRVVVGGLLFALLLHPENGGSMFLRNFGEFAIDCTVFIRGKS